MTSSRNASRGASSITRLPKAKSAARGHASAATAPNRRFISLIAGRPVSVNRMYGHRRGGGVYLSDAAAAWELLVCAECHLQMSGADVRWAWRDAGQPQIAVDVTFYGVRGDVDNYAKSTLDGLKKALDIDDRYFSPLHLHLGESSMSSMKHGARIEIVIPQALTTEPEPATPEVTTEPAPTPASPQVAIPKPLRVVDLVEPQSIAHLEAAFAAYAAGDVVRVSPAFDYGAIVLLFPPSTIAEHDDEWSTFLPLEHARQLRDALNALPELGPALKPGLKPGLKPATEYARQTQQARQVEGA